MTIRKNSTKKVNQISKTSYKPWNNACLNISQGDWFPYIEGYKLAGDMLVGYTTSAKAYQDLLVYPIIFLYRHYFELQLKNIIIDGCKLLNLKRKHIKSHKIDKLWEECAEIFKKIWPNPAQEDFEIINECIKYFSEKDFSSMTFRYPVDLKGNPSLPSGLRHINLKNLLRTVKKASSLLDGAALAISEYLYYKYEMLYQSQSEW